MGILTKSILKMDPDSFRYKFYHGFEETRAALRAVEEASNLCEKHGSDLGTLGVQFGCDCPFCDSTLISAGRTERLDQNMALISQPYDRALAEEVREILGRANIIPSTFDRIAKWDFTKK